MTYQERLDFVDTFEADYGIEKRGDKYYRNNEEFLNSNNENFAIAYAEGVTPTLHKYGYSSSIKDIVKKTNNKLKNNLTNEEYEDMKYHYLEVPKEDYKWINVIINISASHWIHHLREYLSVIEIENK